MKCCLKLYGNVQRWLTNDEICVHVSTLGAAAGPSIERMGGSLLMDGSLNAPGMTNSRANGGGGPRPSSNLIGTTAGPSRDTEGGTMLTRGSANAPGMAKTRGGAGGVAGGAALARSVDSEGGTMLTRGSVDAPGMDRVFRIFFPHTSHSFFDEFIAKFRR